MKYFLRPALIKSSFVLNIIDLLIIIVHGIISKIAVSAGLWTGPCFILETWSLRTLSTDQENSYRVQARAVCVRELRDVCY